VRLSPPGRWRGLWSLTGCDFAALSIVLGLSVVNVMLVNFHRQLFPSGWRSVMWEGGILENLTALNFLAGAVVFLMAAASRPARSAERRWLLAFALASLGLVGEETNYGQGMLWLNLNDPNFESRYNPQFGTLHNLVPAFVPILAFFVLVGGARILHRRIVEATSLPVPAGFLNAVLLTSLALPFMRLDEDRHLFVDEVFEWSGSCLLLCLALHSRWGWFFLPPETPAEPVPSARAS
jgi:hypothetical protein